MFAAPKDSLTSEQDKTETHRKHFSKEHSGKVCTKDSQTVSFSKCPIKEAVKFMAGAWTLEIYWNLRHESKRFGELKRLLGEVSPKVLTQRLRDLEDLGVVDRTVLDTYPPQVEYSLTALGKKFLPILDQIADVGANLVRKSKAKKI